MAKLAAAASLSSLSGLLALFLLGCSTAGSLPAEVLRNAEQTPFVVLQQDPLPYEGRRIVLGGEVLKAKRLPDRTEIEVLQLPLNAREEPIPKRVASQGRFRAYQKDFLDPATIPPGSLITVVGAGRGSVLEKLDEMDYSYPVIESEYIKVWPNRPLSSNRPYPYPYGMYDYYDPWYPSYFPYRSPFFYPGPFFRPFPFRPSHFHFRQGPQHSPRPPQFRRAR
jgi:outer membrane lipoprotein